MSQRTLPAGFIAPCLPIKTDKLPSGGSVIAVLIERWAHESRRMSTRPNLGRKRVPLPQPATKGEIYRCADTGHARHLGKRDAGLRRDRERNDPRIEINSVDFIRRRGYRFAGTAQVLESGPIYDWGRAWLLKHHGPEYPTNHVVLIKLHSAEPLMSPVYTFGGRKEEEVRSTYRQIYGLIPTGDENAAPVIGSFL
jgi:hypothetical protein